MFNDRRSDQVVLITGASGGLGEALARRFFATGAQLALLDLEAPTGLATELGDGRTLALACDVTDPNACTRAVGAVRERFGRLDVLVNNAGITHRSVFASTRVEVIRRVMEVNYFGAVHMTHAALELLCAASGQVVGISSVAGFAPLSGRTGYAASKHALEGFLSTLRAELHGQVDVLVVRPGFVDTGLADRALGGDGARAKHARAEVGRAMSPERAAEAIVSATARRRRTLLLTSESKASWWLSRISPRAYEAVMRRNQRSELNAPQPLS